MLGNPPPPLASSFGTPSCGHSLYVTLQSPSDSYGWSGVHCPLDSRDASSLHSVRCGLLNIHSHMSWSFQNIVFILNMREIPKKPGYSGCFPFQPQRFRILGSVAKSMYSSQSSHWSLTSDILVTCHDLYE